MPETTGDRVILDDRRLTPEPTLQSWSPPASGLVSEVSIDREGRVLEQTENVRSIVTTGS